MRAALFMLLVLAPGLARAEGHSVTVVNRTSEMIRQIHISPAGAASAGENRLRSQLPPNAEARITYSTGCKVDVRISYEGGRTEAFMDQDACADVRVAAGQGATTGTVVSGPASPTAPARRAADVRAAGKPATPVLAPVVVPPWTGHSITKRFGGLD